MRRTIPEPRLRRCRLDARKDRPAEGGRMLRWLLATIHLLALPIGFAAVIARARALRGAPNRAALRRAFDADTWWGIAALLWIGSGTLRAFGGWEKGVPYYMHNLAFAMKMLLLLAVLGL